MPGPYLRKLVEELLDNAFKFSEPGSKVTVQGQAEGDGYALKISDQGRGMTQQQINQVASFIQFDRERFEQQGLGLGLVLARGIAELFELNLSLNSKLGEGLKATVRFPHPDRTEA